MKQAEIYTKRYCPYCVRAKQLLELKGVRYKEFEVSVDECLRSEMLKRSNRKTVPQIFFGDTHIGGSEELYALEHNGQLDEILATTTI